MLKENGYDEFLAQKIEQGVRDFEQGRYVSADEARQRIEQMLMRKEQELQEEMSGAVYG